MVKTKENSKGQLELANIDTPLGEKAEAFLQADTVLRKAQSGKNDCVENLIAEMKKVGIRTLLFDGNRIRYTPGHKTPDKISFRETEN